MVFVYYMTLQGQLIKVLIDFIVKSPLKYVTILSSILTIVPVVVEI